MCPPLSGPLTSRHTKPRDFTAGQRMPASVLLNHKDGVYAIDPGSGEKDDPEKIVLPWLVSREWCLGGLEVDDKVCRAHCLRSS